MFARVFHISAKSKLKIYISFLMALQAGAINTGGFVVCKRFVSHVTGFATLFGVDFANLNFSLAFSMISVPLFFLAGVMFSAYFVDKRVAEHKSPQYTFLIVSIATLMFISAIGGELGWFGPLNIPADAVPNYPLIAILCLACGIQNASITSASSAIIRTTHLTGNTTDLGLGLVKIFAHKHHAEIKNQEIRSTIIRIGIIGFFILGSTLSAFLFLKIGFLGFLLPAGISSSLLIWDLSDRLLKKSGVHHG